MSNSSCSSSINYLGALVGALETMKDQAKLDGGKTASFKIRSYNNVIKQIKAIPVIRSPSDLSTLTGVGEGIQKKIDEVLATGTLAAAETIKSSDKVGVYKMLMNCYGIGVAKAKTLAATGIKTVADLRAAATANPKLLTAGQRIGLTHYEEFLERISREEMLAHESFLKSAITGIQTDIVGSFRRGAVSSGDIDLLLCSADSKDLRTTIRTLIASGYITDTLANGEKKFMGVCRLPGAAHRRLDILLTPPQEYPFALVYFTGPMEFNVKMRSRCLELGYTLNEHRLDVAPGAMMEDVPMIRDERDLFVFLGMKYLGPTERDPKNIEYK
uniref:DNA-directed DNA polymerase n=1 Tax=viral metagenome TaxID=1070528 RepID=A0A6C0DHZ2_9ZZZZ